ncbi:uroporphyrinogen-III synthase [Bartonella sp. HY761]|uniref:uroporphyrinogen-III synthase n=1 Tax=Bartonella sp. HY761 TaxID=2979330 RepID=UPI002207DFD8|nr:uroporphyrinogen-III synthase [Bartonella sp. HY761]UXN06820.1 uroporphyrinogen-III synthase [Bartonella sp. HY761]
MVQGGDKASKTILVTRPIESSQKTQEYILAKGFNTIIAPLSRLEPCNFILPEDLSQFDGLCASSAAAFLATSHQNDPKFEIIKELPLFCVGSKTAKAAQNAGFRHVAAIAQDADQLVSLLKSSNYQHFLYLAGKQRRPVLEDGLTAQGRLVTTILTYEAFAMTPNKEKIAKSMQFDAVLLYSTLGLNGLEVIDGHFNHATKFLCLSKRIAQSLPQKYQPQAIIASEPTEENLLKLL